MKWESRFGNSKRLIPVQTESEKRKHRCAFTGHRPEKLTRSELEIKQRLKEMVQSAIADGYNVFITGMARGVDLWAAEIVLEMKQKNRDVKLICAPPYEGFEQRWSREWIKLYRYVLKKADYVHVVSPAYSRDVFLRRNIWMVDHSMRIIAVYNNVPGGTRNTIEYAKKSNLEIELLENV